MTQSELVSLLIAFICLAMLYLLARDAVKSLRGKYKNEHDAPEK